MKMVEAISGMTRTYTFVFDPDPEGGFVVTCPALPGPVTHGVTIEEPRMMTHDAMEGYIPNRPGRMSRLPALKPKDVLAALQRAGFAVARVRGSRYQLLNPSTKRCVTVPPHTLSKAILASILNQAGLAD